MVLLDTEYPSILLDTIYIGYLDQCAPEYSSYEKKSIRNINNEIKIGVRYIFNSNSSCYIESKSPDIRAVTGIILENHSEISAELLNRLSTIYI